MATWEYLQIDVTSDAWRDSTGRDGKVPEIRMKSGRSIRDMTSILNERGAERWELTGVAGSESHLKYQLFLKRPKA